MSALFESITRHACEAPQKGALCGAGQTISYSTLIDEVRRRKNILAEQNVKVLGLQINNSPDWILWDLAALKSGIVCVPLPPFFSNEQINYVKHSAGIDACVYDRGIVKTETGNSVSIPEKTAKITFTSGTTGTPKGVCLPASGLEQLAVSLQNVIGPEYAERHLSILPLGVLLENVAGVYTALMAGAEIHIPAPHEIGMDDPFQPDFSGICRYISEQKITSIILVPELLRGLMRELMQNHEISRSLRYVAVGGAKVSPELIHAARASGLPVYEGYGLSECGSVVALNTPSSDHVGTAGVILPHIKAEILHGEIVIQNPAFLGYLGETPRDPGQVFATGDLGEFDQNGALKITGRCKNVIITAQGRNISPEWIESLLLIQPEIGQAFVYGNDLPFPAALIVPASGNADIGRALEKVNEALPSYARVERFDIVSPFTLHNGMLTGTGRMRREEISKTYKTLVEKEMNNDILRRAG